mmetsp:Transcript_56054/g.111281  ORF Transcript_56054/g.111281 Transcript_56054/m.111281 type:complete len:224 (-) Transcript_56054:411-1082(-)
MTRVLPIRAWMALVARLVAVATSRPCSFAWRGTRRAHTARRPTTVARRAVPSASARRSTMAAMLASSMPSACSPRSRRTTPALRGPISSSSRASSPSRTWVDRTAASRQAARTRAARSWLLKRTSVSRPMTGCLTLPRERSTFVMSSTAWASLTRTSLRSRAPMPSAAATRTAQASGGRGLTASPHSPTTTTSSSSKRNGPSRRRTRASLGQAPSSTRPTMAS